MYFCTIYEDNITSRGERLELLVNKAETLDAAVGYFNFC